MKYIKNILPQISILLSSVLWGTSFIFTKGLFQSEETITPIIILTGRLLVASVVFIPILLTTKQLEPLQKKHIGIFFLIAFFEPFLYSICETSGIKHVPGSLASVIIATIPLFIPICMAIFYHEKLRPNTLIGLAIALCGIAIMTRNDGTNAPTESIGIILLTLAVVIAIVYTLFLVKLLKLYRPTTITAYQNLISLLYFIPLLCFTDIHRIPQLSFSSQMVLPIVFLGIFCSSIAYMLYNYGMKKLGATTGSIYNNTIPVFSFLFALMIGQERATILNVTGMFVVLFGLFLAQYQFKKNTSSKI